MDTAMRTSPKAPQALSAPQARLGYEIWVLAGILVLAAIFRIPSLGRMSLWDDELRRVVSVMGVTDAFGLIAAPIASAQVQPPLDYAILFLVSRVGTDEMIVRLPAAIWGILTVLATYALARELFGRSTGLVAAFLTSVSVTAIHYSQELAPYSLATLLSTCSLYFVAVALTARRSRAWIGYGVCSLLGLYTNIFAAVMIASIGAWLVATYCVGRAVAMVSPSRCPVARFRDLLSFAKASLAAGLGFAPILLLLWWWLTGPVYVRAPIQFAWLPLERLAWAFSQFASQPSLGIWGMRTSQAVLWPFAAIALFGMCSFAVRRAAWQVSLIATAGVVFVLLMDYAFARSSSVQLQVRYVLYALPPFLIAVAAGVVSLGDLVARLTSRAGLASFSSSAGVAAILSVVLGLVALNLDSLTAYYRDTGKNDWRGIAEYISRNYQDGDVVINTNIGYSGLALPFYFDRYDLTRKTVTIESPAASIPNKISAISRSPRGWWAFPGPPAPGFADALGGDFRIVPFFNAFLVEKTRSPDRTAKGVLRDSIVVYEAAARFWTVDATVFTILGHLYVADGRPHEAIGQYLRAGEDTWSLYNAGTALQRAGDLDGALAYFLRSVEADGGNHWACLSAADIYRRRGALDLALPLYEKASQRAPDLVWAHVGLGEIHRAKGDPAKAATHFRKAVEVGPAVGPAHFGLAEAARALGETDLAVDEYRKAIELEPGSVWAYVRLGDLHRSQGKLAEAQEVYERGVQVEPRMVWIHVGLGETYRARGKIAEARQAFLRALEIEPGNEAAKNGLALVGG